MLVKILHILPDEKCIDFAIDTFNDVKSSLNTYITIDNIKPFVYIKSHAHDVQIVNKKDVLSVIIDGGYHMVVFHTLTYDKYELIMQIPKSVKVTWISWGYDIYFSHSDVPPILSLELYKRLTKEYVKQAHKISFGKRLKRLLKQILFLKHNIEDKKRISKLITTQQCVLNRIDYMSTVLPSEYDALRMNPYFNAEYFPFQYVANRSPEIEWVDDKASCILLGNSATETNNHLDIINILKKRNISNDCILPCSYGDENYLHYLENQTNSNNQVHLIKNFMPRGEYKAMLRSCRVGVFGHIRQQAIGNIILCMLQGNKVFLYKDSVAYQYFSANGYLVFSIDDELSQESIQQLLTEAERMHNVTKICKMFSYDDIVNKLEKTINTILE